MQQRAERRDMRRFLAHLDLAVADHHAVDAEGGRVWVRLARVISS